MLLPHDMCTVVYYVRLHTVHVCHFLRLTSLHIAFALLIQLPPVWDAVPGFRAPAIYAISHDIGRITFAKKRERVECIKDLK